MFGVSLLNEALQTVEGSATVTQVATVEEALTTIKKGVDLVITHWCWRQEPGSTGEDLLQAIRTQDLRTPVLVFSQAGQADVRKPVAFGLGAAGYTYSWETLVGEIERILG